MSASVVDTRGRARSRSATPAPFPRAPPLVKRCGWKPVGGSRGFKPSASRVVQQPLTPDEQPAPAQALREPPPRPSAVRPRLCPARSRFRCRDRHRPPLRRRGSGGLGTTVPNPATAVGTAVREAFVVLGGTLLPADRPYRSGKHEKHGMNVQVIADPSGRLQEPHPPCPARTTTSKPPVPKAPSAHAGRGRRALMGGQGVPRCRRHRLGAVPRPLRKLSAGRKAVNVSRATIRAVGE